MIDFFCACPFFEGSARMGVDRAFQTSPNRDPEFDQLAALFVQRSGIMSHTS